MIDNKTTESDINIFDHLQLQIKVVLVKSLYDRNIGSTSRAMANMGFRDLILLSPQCEITYEAQLAAATGQEALQNRIVYNDWNHFFENESDGIRLAFTARDGRGRATRDFSETLNWLKNNSPYFDMSVPKKSVYLYLIFGPEDAGLSSEDISHAHFCVSIPTYGENPSLNLSQATLLAMFSVRQFMGGKKTTLEGQQPVRDLDIQKAFLPDKILQEWLIELGVDLSKKKINAFTVLKRMFMQNTPTYKEFQMLETMLQQTIRKLKELKDLKLKK